LKENIVTGFRPYHRLHKHIPLSVAFLRITEEQKVTRFSRLLLVLFQEKTTFYLKTKCGTRG